MKIAWTLAPRRSRRRCSRAGCSAKPIFDAYPFSLGVASGDPLPDGVVLWTRLAPKPLDGGGMPMNIVDVEWEIARDARFRTSCRKAPRWRGRSSGTACTSRSPGLEPAREYFYRFHAGDEVSQIGRTRTAPPAGARGRSPALRRLRLPALRGRLLHRVPAHRRRAVRLRLPHRRLHLRRARRRRPERPALPPAPRRRDLHARRLPQPLRALQDRPRPVRRARLRAVGRHLGRSRGRQQLRRRHRRAQHAAGDLPAAPRRRLSGLLRDDAAARQRAAVGQPHAPLSPPAVRQPDRSQRPRYAAVAIRSAVRRRLAHRLRGRVSRRRRR